MLRISFTFLLILGFAFGPDFAIAQLAKVL